MTGEYNVIRKSEKLSELQPLIKQQRLFLNLFYETIFSCRTLQSYSGNLLAATIQMMTTKTIDSYGQGERWSQVTSHSASLPGDVSAEETCFNT